MLDSLRPHELQPTRLLYPWDFPGKSTRVGCQCLLWSSATPRFKSINSSALSFLYGLTLTFLSLITYMTTRKTIALTRWTFAGKVMSLLFNTLSSFVIPGGGHGNPLQYSCLENPCGQRSLEGYSTWSRKESDRTEQLGTAQHRSLY